MKSEESSNFLDAEEYLHLINLRLQLGRVEVHPIPDQYGEQGWLNEVYSQERLDIGLESNAFTYVKDKYPDIWAKLGDSLTIIHFAGNSKPVGSAPCPGEVEALCVKWREYRDRVFREVIGKIPGKKNHLSVK